MRMKLKSVFTLEVLETIDCGEWDHYPTESEMEEALIAQFGSCTHFDDDFDDDLPIIFEVKKRNIFHGEVLK